MNTLRLITCLFLINAVFQSCNQEDAFDCVKSTGAIRSEQRIVPAFHTIILKDNIYLILDTTAAQNAVVEAGKNLLPKIDISTTGDTLIISNKNTCEWVRSAKYPVTVTVGIPAEGLTLIHQGYGKVTSAGTLSARSITVYSESAGGNIDLQIQSASLTMYSNTHALINLTGKADNAFLWINKGIGRIHAENLQVQHCTVKHAGSNEIRVYPLDTLQVEILQNGNVAYYHEPASLISSIRGTGKLIKR
jgi:hypothetical protein